MKKDIEWAKNKIDLEVIRRIGREDPHFYVNVGLKMALDFLNKLDEPETLSPDWISDNVEYAYYMTPRGTYSSAKAVIDPNKLEDLLVPKQEKVIVDKEDAENIVDYKEMGWALSHLIDDYGEDARHDELLARAWLAYPNIEVEEEQKYYALIKGHENIGSDDKYWNYCITDESLDIGDNKVHTDVLAEYVLSATKDDWGNLGINDDNADFVKVEELEE